MKLPALRRYALCFGTAALLAACGGSQPPIGAPGAMPQSQTSVVAAHAQRDGSWMLPEATSQDLLYVSGGNEVDVYAYPSGEQVGSLTNFHGTGYECADSAGDVFITTGSGSPSGVYEYAHGGSQPISFLSVPYSAAGCSVDPLSGNLAVVGIDSDSVYVFVGAQGSPVAYRDPDLRAWDVAYDDSGNLFAHGSYGNDQLALVELPKGGSEFQDITIESKLDTAYGAMLWDGKYIDIATETAAGPRRSVVNRLKVANGKATTIGKVWLARQETGYWPEFWIDSDMIIEPSTIGRIQKVFSWKYPGGKEMAKISDPNNYRLWGVTLSSMPSHARVQRKTLQ